MATVKYQVSCKYPASITNLEAPMRLTIEEAIEAYRTWPKRPIEDEWLILELHKRDKQGEWGFLGDREFNQFRVGMETGAFPEMGECRQRWDKVRIHTY